MISFASDHADLLRGGRRAAWRDQGSQKRKFPDTHIRHALPREPLQSAMLSVAVPMVSRSFGTLLVAGIGLLVDQPLALLPARLTAVPLTVEITAADEEPPTAEPAEKLDEDREDVHPAAPNERKLDAPSRPRDPPLTRLRTRARFCRPKLRRALASFSPRCLSLDRPEAPREFQVTLPVPVPVANFPRILMAIDILALDEGKDLFQIVTELRIPPERVRALYREWREPDLEQHEVARRKRERQERERRREEGDRRHHEKEMARMDREMNRLAGLKL